MKTITEAVQSLYGEIASLPYSIKLSFSPYLASPFGLSGQGDLIFKSYLASFVQDLPTLDSQGVCNGLCVDYARHVISHKNSKTKSDYIAKLKRKFTVFGKNSKNFAKRTQLYQEDLQSSIVGGDIKLSNASSEINDNKFIESLPKELDTSSVIGLTFSGAHSGHIIAIQVIKNDNSEITGYKIFDPNIGEFDFSKSGSAAESTQHCNEVIKNIYHMYEAVGMKNCSTVDLEKLVTTYELVKTKNLPQYRSEAKYLDKNPNKQAIQNKKLYNAASLEKAKEVQLLLDTGADINKAADDGYTPLGVAASRGNKEIIKLLLANGADVNKAINNGATPLYIAAQEGKKEVAQLLLANGADVNKATNNGATPLYIAAEKGNKEIEKILQAAIFKEKIIETLKSISVSSSLHKEVASLPSDLQAELAKQLKLDIEKLAKQSKGFSIKKIISIFPEESRVEYFAESARKAIIECAAQGNDKKIDLILEAFPKQLDRVKILNDALFTKFTPRSKPLLIKRKAGELLEAVNIIYSPFSTPKIPIAVQSKTRN